MMQASSSPAAPNFLLSSHREFPGLKEVLYLTFNQNQTCFLCGTESGFKVFTCDSLDQKICRVTSNQGFGIVEILLNSSIFALVGGGKNPSYSPKSVLFYNDLEQRCFGELTFRSAVRAVKMQMDFIVVVLEFKVYVYSFGDLKLVHEVVTLSNVKGVCATAPGGVVVCPGQRTGWVRVEQVGAVKGCVEIQAHSTAVACVAVSLDGALVATASARGTVVNVFRTSDGTKVQELRRGTDQADIYSMAFSPDPQFFALSGSRGTVHIFRMQVNQAVDSNVATLSSSGVSRSQLFRAGSMLLSTAAASAGAMLLSSVAATAGSSFSVVKGVVSKYLISDRSLCQFRLPSGSRATVGFGPNDHTIIILCTDGSLYECSFDPVKGGLCHLLNHFSFT